MAIVLGRSALISDATLRIARGATYTAARFRYTTGNPATPVDLTGWTARAQLRDTYGGTVWITLTHTTGITLGGTAGTIALTIPYAATEAVEWDRRSIGLWDLELTNTAGVRIRFAEGPVEVSQDVTRD